MLEKLEKLRLRYDELSRELADPHVYADRRRAARLGREQSQLQPIADLYPRYAARHHRYGMFRADRRDQTHEAGQYAQS